MKKKLATAFAWVAEATKNKFDKGGNPYILHLIFVMQNSGDDEATQIAALFHDSHEDGEFTLDEIANEFGREVADIVHVLTHYPEDSYDTYIRKVSMHPKARTIKKADLKHNADLTRIKGFSQKNFTKLEQYYKAYAYLS